MKDSDKKTEEKCLKKSNLLVYQQPTGKRTDRKADDCKGKIKIPICTPKPKPIKICTGAELRKMCPPKICPDQMPKGPTKLARMLGFGLKSVVAAALVYVTYDMGIWGTAEDTQQLYGAACTMFGAPQPKKNDKWDPPSCEAESELFNKSARHSPYGHCEEAPIKAEESYLKFKNVWNGAVTTIFQGLANFPYNVMSRAKRNNQDAEKTKPACVAYSQMDEEEIKRVQNKYK